MVLLAFIEDIKSLGSSCVAIQTPRDSWSSEKLVLDVSLLIEIIGEIVIRFGFVFKNIQNT
jgi:hypothetical protein